MLAKLHNCAMGYLRKNESGGVLVFELVLLVLVLVAAGYAVWQYQQNKNAVNQPVTPTIHHTPSPSATPDPYAGWQSYTSKTEGLSFKYPSTWTFDNTGASNPAEDGGSFNGPSGLQVDWNSDISGIGGACNKAIDPHVFFYQITPQPSLSNAYVIALGNGSVNSVSLVNTQYDTFTPIKLGDTGDCLFYPLFKSKDSSRNMMLQGEDFLGGKQQTLSTAQISLLNQILLSVHY